MTHRFVQGWVPDLPDWRDHPLTLPAVDAALPPSYDLRAGFAPCYDQGDLGSCTGNATAAAIQYDEKRQGLKALIPSRLFIYYNARVLEGSANSDSGAMLRDCIKVCAKYGTVPEPVWPYIISRFAVQPPPPVYQQALSHQILEYQKVPQSLRELKTVLASGFPIVFGFSVYESMETPAVDETGDVPMPEWSEQMLGGHAVVLVGYHDATQRFAFRNSWGTGWGVRGYGTLPYAYVCDAGLASDFWRITRIE